jgi:predicted small secreted protein
MPVKALLASIAVILAVLAVSPALTGCATPRDVGLDGGGD